MSHMKPAPRSRAPRLALAVTVVPVALAAGGCAGVLWGQLLVLGVALGIFVGTLALGRPASVHSTASEASASRR